MIYLLTCYFQNGRLDVVKFLIEKGAKVDRVDKRDITPLSIASEVGFFSVK